MFMMYLYWISEVEGQNHLPFMGVCVASSPTIQETGGAQARVVAGNHIPLAILHTQVLRIYKYYIIWTLSVFWGGTIYDFISQITQLLLWMEEILHPVEIGLIELFSNRGVIPSRKLTYFLKINVWKMKFLLDDLIFRAHVSFLEDRLRPSLHSISDLGENQYARSHAVVHLFVQKLWWI